MTELEQMVFELFNLAKSYLPDHIMGYDKKQSMIELFSKCINKIRENKESIDEFHKLILKDIENGFLKLIDWYYLYKYYIIEEYIKQLIDSLCKCYTIPHINFKNEVTEYLIRIIKKWNHLFFDHFLIPLLIKFDHMELEMSNIKLENKKLKDQIDYSPDGIGYEESKEHFKKLVSQESNNI